MMLEILVAAVLAQEKGQWVNLSEEVVAEAVPEGKTPFGGPTEGIAVDPATGDVYLVMADNGLWKSADGGKSWTVAAALPPGLGVGLVGPNYAWDAKRNLFYASSMGRHAFKYAR